MIPCEMIPYKPHKFLIITLLLIAASLFVSACSGSKAETKKKETIAGAAAPAVIDVTTAPAIMRQLPRYVEATGSLAADEQTDVAPAVAG